MTEKKLKKHWALTLLSGFGLGVLVALRMMLKAMILVAKLAADGLEHLGASGKSEAQVEGTASQAGISEIKTRHTHPGAVVISRNDSACFLPADRIVTVRLDPAVAILHLRVFHATRKVSIEMIVIEPRLRTLMQQRHHVLAEVDFDPVKGTDPLIENAVALAQARFNAVASVKVVQAEVKPPAPKTPPKAVHVARNESVQPTEKKPAVVPADVEKPKPLEPAVVATQSAVPGSAFVPNEKKPVKFVGKLKSAGPQTMRPRNRPSYELFEAVLCLDNGLDVPLRGAELERELQRCNVKLGDMLEVTPMGKIPVDLADGSTGGKNLYRVIPLNRG